MKETLFSWILLIGYFTFAQTSSDLRSKSIPVLSEKLNIVEIKDSDFTSGQRMLFVRIVPEYDEFEIIAEGTVLDKRNGRTRVKLKTEKIKKIPTPNDYAVLLGEPKTFKEPKVEKSKSIVSLEQNDFSPSEPGYISFFGTNVNGRLSSTSSNIANSLKQVDSFKTAGFGMEWFFDFIPSYGISYLSAVGKVPVFSYFKNEEPTTYEVSEFKILFRSERLKAPGWRWRLSLNNWTSKFKTTNSDAYVLSSQTVSNGLGFSVSYDWKMPLDVPAHVWGGANSIYAGFNFYPDVSLTDGAVSRGSASSGSSQSNLYVGYTHDFNFKFIPYINRWYLDLKYNQMTQKIKMSGPTTSESGGFYKIPESGNYSESQSLIEISLGVRFPDVIGSSLKSRN